ncbi:MAG: patatin family protein [Lachnospiraceae bacterium]|nr:patatin family protein [Lachnospiraceae bacterium]
MKTGLVLEGGAMKGMYTAGVLDVFMDEGITFDGIIGVSAGAIFGVNYLSGQKGRAIRYNKRFNGDKDYMGFRTMLKTGNIINTEYAYERVPRDLDPFDNETYTNSEVPFYAVTTDIKTGKPVYHQITDVFAQMDVIRASGSMPFVSKPVTLSVRDEMTGEETISQHLDGAITDSIPFEKFAKMGYEKQVVVLTKDITYVKGAIPAWMAKLRYRKYPEFAKRIMERHIMYNGTIERLKQKEKEGKVIVIRPSQPITISKIESDPAKLQAVYDLGIMDARTILGRVKEFL